jgi:hypothetical protein
VKELDRALSAGVCCYCHLFEYIKIICYVNPISDRSSRIDVDSFGPEGNAKRSKCKQQRDD